MAALSAQLEPWERQLALVEILLLSGGTPYANFKDLAHAWGREKGFHQVLAASVCERRGEVERKRRSDAGRILTREEREAFRDKLKRPKTMAAAARATEMTAGRGPASEAGSSSEAEEQIVMMGEEEELEEGEEDDEAEFAGAADGAPPFEGTEEQVTDEAADEEAATDAVTDETADAAMDEATDTMSIEI